MVARFRKKKKLPKEDWEFKKKKLQMKHHYYVRMYSDLISGLKTILYISFLSIWAGSVFALMIHILN